MIELSQHIEALLLENDCVIVPGFGGFVAHYTSALRDEKENLFLPPVRSIGFNPLMKLNDGLLVQAYMNTYNTSYPDAAGKVERGVEQMSNKLYNDGKVELPNIGEIRYTMRQSYEFTPFDNKLTTPSLYGLDAFEMKKLHALPKTVEPAVAKREIPVKEKKEFHINYTYAANVAAAIAIIALFFGFSVPVENTYIEKRNYAQLMPSDLFEKIESKSLVFTPVITKKNAPMASHTPKNTPTASHTPTKNTPTTSHTSKNTVAVTPVKKAAEPIAKAAETTRVLVKEKPQTMVQPQTTGGNYHIIVAGGVMRKNAEIMVSQLKEKGFSQACVLNCDGKIRVSLMSFGTGTEATNKMLKLRENEEFKNAWMLANN